LEEVKRILGKRRWTFRNADRMNLLIELVRIRTTTTPTKGDFAKTLRRQLSKVQPRFSARRPVGVPPLRGAAPCQDAGVSSSLSKVEVGVEW
jgi:hypothetical protein